MKAFKKSICLLLFSVAFLSFSSREHNNLNKLTNGKEKSWIFGHYLLNGYSLDDHFKCRINSEWIFKNDESFSADTSCAHTGEFIHGLRYKILESKMIIREDTYDIVEFTDAKLKLSMPYMVKFKDVSKFDEKAILEVIFYAK